MRICKKCEEPLNENYEICFWCEYMPANLVKKTKQITFSIFVPCRRCKQAIPVFGPYKHVKCPDCGSITELMPESFAQTFHLVSKGMTPGSHAQGFDVAIYDRPGPKCKTCDEQFSVLEHLKEMEKGQKIVCQKCKNEINYLKAPESLTKLNPNIGFIIADKEEDQAERHILLNCISCGAGLEIKTGDERLLTCKHCDRIMYLSDDAWQILHSAVTQRPWTVTYDRKWIKESFSKRRNKNKQVLSDSKLSLLTVSFYKKCIKCGSIIPLNGPTRSAICQECGTIRKIDRLLLAECIASNTEGKNSVVKGKTVPSVIYTNHKPQCHICDEPIEIFDYVDRGNFTEPIICGNCGNELPQFPMPRWLKKHIPKAYRLFGAFPETRLQNMDQSKDADSISFVMSCETCGNEINRTINSESTRIIQCENCSSSALLPVEIWRRIHPMRLLTRWSILHKAPSIERREFLRERIHDYFTWDLRHYFEDLWEKAPASFKKRVKRLILLFRTRIISFVIKLKCRYCGGPVYVNGPLNTITCSTCMKELNISPYRLAYKLFLASDNKGEMFNQDFVVEFWRKKTLPCNNCSADVKIPVSKLDSGKHVEIKCPDCNSVLKGGPPPKWLKEIIPNISGIFNGIDTVAVKKSSVTEEGSTNLVSTDCPDCGKNIYINFESKRTVFCEACNNEIFIPDKLWRKLHPITRSQRWAVIFRGTKFAEPDEALENNVESYY